MRVMVIGPYPTAPDRIDGGAASALTYLSQSLVADLGVELIGVRTSWEGVGAADRRAFDWEVVDLPLGRLSLTTLYRRPRQRLAELIRHYRPQIAHGQGTDVAGYLAVESGLPSVVTVHGLLAECAKHETNLVARARATLTAMMLERSCVRQASDLIAISPYVSRYYGREIRGRVHDIPNAIPPSYFRVRRAPERGRLLYAGRVSKGKGVLDLLQAVACCPGQVSRLVLAGASPDPAFESAVRSEIDRLNLRDKVALTGLLDEAALLEQFARAEALVLPSYQETAPMVVQQAMAAGLAVIATRVGGVPWQLEHDCSGLLFDAGDVGGLTRLLERIGNDVTLAARLGAAARAAAGTFKAQSVAIATEAVYRQVLGNTNHRSAKGCAR